MPTRHARRNPTRSVNPSPLAWSLQRAEAEFVGFILGLIVILGSLLGGFVAMGGHVGVLWQPWEYVIICGTALGTYMIANPLGTV
ncbi:MAG TPA: motility-associated protein, partial [Paracoccaceae bacterium]|nr:motility-associated protein [Paracoccaceae bacterium]